MICTQGPSFLGLTTSHYHDLTSITGLISLTEYYFTEYKTEGMSEKGIGMFDSHKWMALQGHLLAERKEKALTRMRLTFQAKLLQAMALFAFLWPSAGRQANKLGWMGKWFLGKWIKGGKWLKARDNRHNFSYISRHFHKYATNKMRLMPSFASFSCYS